MTDCEVSVAKHRLPGERPTVTIRRRGQLDDLTLEVECSAETAATLTRQLDIGIGLRIEAQPVAVGSLPRSDGKSKRWIDLRG